MSDTTTQNDNPAQEPVAQETVLGSQVSDNQSTDWRSSLSDELKNDSTLANIKDVESAAKTLIHQQKMLGSRIPMPKSDEERSELYNKLGRPNQASEYKVEVPQSHESYFQEDNLNEFKNVAHNIGLNQSQVDALINYQLKTIDTDASKQDSRLAVGKQETENSLKQEWGYDYDKQVRNAKRALEVYGNPELQQLMQGEAGNNPAVVKFFARIGKDITEDMAKNTQNNTLATSPLDAKAEIDGIYANSNHPYHKPYDKGHKEAVEHMRQLHEKVFGKS
jgi:hypothetical protein